MPWDHGRPRATLEVATLEVVVLGHRTSEALGGWTGPVPAAPSFEGLLLPALVLIAVLLALVVVGLVIVLAEHRGTRSKSLTDREAEVFAAAVAAGDFEAAERSIRWALALVPNAEPSARS